MDTLLTMMLLTDMVDEDHQQIKGKNDFGVGTFMIVLISLFLVTGFVLTKLGVPYAQLEQLVTWLLAPFAWDYWVNFMVQDLTNVQHILASLGTFGVAFILMMICMGCQSISERLAKIQSAFAFGVSYVLYMAALLVSKYLLAVCVVAMIKIVIHVMMACFAMLF